MDNIPVPSLNEKTEKKKKKQDLEEKSSFHFVRFSPKSSRRDVFQAAIFFLSLVLIFLWGQEVCLLLLSVEITTLVGMGVGRGGVDKDPRPDRPPKRSIFVTKTKRKTWAVDIATSPYVPVKLWLFIRSLFFKSIAVRSRSTWAAQVSGVQVPDGEGRWLEFLWKNPVTQV